MATERRLPVRPELERLEREADELLIDPTFDGVTLADARLALATSYGAPSWERLEQSCRLIDALWEDDRSAVRDLVQLHPELLRENAGIGNGNWGPPLSYAANLGRDAIIMELHRLGATDLEHALNRALLQSRTGTARKLHEMLGGPRPTAGALTDPGYTLSAEGTALLFEWGAEAVDASGGRIAPVEVVLETDGRHPTAKHAILELYVEHGLAVPDTPTMAVHRGRADLLAAHLLRDPGLLRRTFRYDEIFPPELGCSAGGAALGMSLDGATLMHLCVEYDELDLARLLIEQGMGVDVRAAIDDEGLGGHTALFAAVVSYPAFWTNLRETVHEARFAELLLANGADPCIRASLRARVLWGDDTTEHVYRDVTPLEFGEQFHSPMYVNRAALRLLSG